MSLRFATTVQGKAFFTSEYVQKVFPIIIVPLYHDDPISLCAKLTQYRDRQFTPNYRSLVLLERDALQHSPSHR